MGAVYAQLSVKERVQIERWKLAKVSRTGKRIAAYRAFNYLFTPLPHAGPKVRKDAMANTVSLSDVLADYINRYGLSEKARQYFLERVQRDGSLETCESVNERLEGTA